MSKATIILKYKQYQAKYLFPDQLREPPFGNILTQSKMENSKGNLDWSCSYQALYQHRQNHPRYIFCHSMKCRSQLLS